MKLARFLSMALVAVCASQAPAYAQMNWKLASAAQPGSPLIGSGLSHLETFYGGGEYYTSSYPHPWSYHTPR